MSYRFTLILIALCAVFMPASGQNDLKNDTKNASVACPIAKDLANTDFFGTWVLELQASTSSASASVTTTQLTMQRNPEFAESLAGHFLLGSVRHEVFGDIEDGALDLEESNNGKDIFAIWKGRVREGSCGQAITGTRRLTATPSEQSFVLRRAGW
jgi:hypothetical protein